MNLEAIPGRVFLDTNVINFMLDYGGQIHDGAPIPQNLSARAVKDVDALYNLFLTGQRGKKGTFYFSDRLVRARGTCLVR